MNPNTRITAAIFAVCWVFMFGLHSDAAMAQDAFLVKDIIPGTGGSEPTALTNVNGTLFFSGIDESNGRELWKSDGSVAGTILVKDVFSGSNSSNPSQLTNVDGTLFFTVSNFGDREELWKSDGSSGGTIVLVEGGFGASIGNLTNVNGMLFFTMEEGASDNELWKSDGTPVGTMRVSDIRPGDNGSFPIELTSVNNTLFFNADDGSGGEELWKSDGTAGGTTMVKDILPDPDDFFGSQPQQLTDLNGVLLFRADDVTHGVELWRSDGTSGGTVLVKDINEASNASSTPTNLTRVNGVLFFGAVDGSSLFPTHGNELWKSDGTGTGTVLVKDINLGPAFSDPRNLTNVGGTLFFTADNGSSGRELFVSNGTDAGTALVKDIEPGLDPSFPTELTNLSGTLFFTADNTVQGIELWKSDGTSTGTTLVKDIRPGTASANPSQLTNVNGTLFFSAQDDTNGRELWAVFPSVVLAAAVLPGSRSVTVGTTATAFATIINASSSNATGCRITPITSVAADFFFQTTDPATNALSGTRDTAVNIAPGAAQTFVFGFTPTAAFGSTDVQLQFSCIDARDAGVVIGLNTLLLSASTTPIPDMVALGATVNNDGIVHIPGTTGTGFFSVASVNVGASDTLMVSVDTGAATLPVLTSICETDPITSVCVNPATPTTGEVTLSIGANATPTFAVFVQGSEDIALDPANKRVFVCFKDAGGVTRGSTSVAVQTD